MRYGRRGLRLSLRTRIGITAGACAAVLILTSVGVGGVFATTVQVAKINGFVGFGYVQPTVARCLDQVTDIQPDANTGGTIDRVNLKFTKSNVCNGIKLTINIVDSTGARSDGSVVVSQGASAAERVPVKGAAKKSKNPQYYLIVS